MGGLTLSVVMTNYNHAKLLPRAVRSILSQSLIPDEFIIIDDCSTDNSVEVIDRIVKENPSIKFFRNEANLGANRSFNRGMSLARGQFVYLATADDLPYEDLLQNSMALLSKHPHAGLSSAIVKITDQDGKGVLRMPLVKPSRVACYLSPAECLRLLRKYDSWMGYSSRIFRREAALEFGGLKPELTAFGDVFLETLLVLKYGACFIPKEMTSYTLMPGSFTAKFRSDLGGELECYAHAAHLMKTAYAGIIPADYADSWERRIAYRAKLSAVKKMFDWQADVLSGVIPKKNIIDKLILLCAKSGASLQFACLLLYLYVRLGADMRMELRRSLLIKIGGFTARLRSIR